MLSFAIIKPGSCFIQTDRYRPIIISHSLSLPIPQFLTLPAYYIPLPHILHILSNQLFQPWNWRISMKYKNILRGSKGTAESEL